MTDLCHLHIRRVSLRLGRVYSSRTSCANLRRGMIIGAEYDQQRRGVVEYRLLVAERRFDLALGEYARPQSG